MKVLVTGGAGFIGSHLCERLIDNKIDVLCLDNFITGNINNISRLRESNCFSFIDKNLIDFETNELFSDIYNLASPASPVAYKKYPLETIKTNIVGSFNMLEIARKGKAKIFQASTSEVYGDPKEHPQKESYFGNVNTMGERSCYNEGKRCAETIFYNYHVENKIDIRIGRIFNTYGPRMEINDGRVMSNFIIQALRNKPITIYGEGKQTRSFCYIDDLIDGILAFMDKGIVDTTTINFGNPIEIDIKSLANKIINIIGSSSNVIYKPLPNDDPIRRKPDIDRANSLLGWYPKVDLESGLLKTIKHFEGIVSKASKLKEKSL